MKVIVDNIILNYEQMGQGDKNLLILHGWGRSLREWMPVAAALSDYTITLLDLPGFGNSEESPEPLDTYDYSTIVAKFLEKIHAHPTVIIGHSFGGRIATTLAANQPDTVQKIVLVDAGGIEIKSFSIKCKIFLYKYFFKHFKKLIPKNIKRFLGSSDYRAISGTLQKSFVKIVNQDLRHLFSKIQQPATVIWGNNDSVLPVRYVKIYQQFIPQALVRIIWGAGHSPHISHPFDFISVLREVL